MIRYSFKYDFREKIPNFIQQRSMGNIFIPKELMKIPELSINEKIYLAAYLNFDNNIFEADNYIRQIVTNATLINIKKHLMKLNYIQNEYISNIEEAKRLTIEKSHKGQICDWCNMESYILQEHHYPIPKIKGGKNIVKICPNCHYTFHKLIGNNYYMEEN